MRILSAALAACAGLLLCGPAATARHLRPNWPFDKLMTHADLVVVAAVVAVEAAGDPTPPGQGNWPDVFVAQNTTFKVVHALKGDPGKTPIKVLHFRDGRADTPKPRSAFTPADSGVQFARHQTADTIGEGGPCLVSFGVGPVVRRGEGERKLDRLAIEFAPKHLLFLKKRKDGRYEPVTGWDDADLSVRLLAEPTRDRE